MPKRGLNEMFWLILYISGELAMIWGPATKAECEIRQSIMTLDKPVGYEYRCMRGKVELNRDAAR